MTFSEFVNMLFPIIGAGSSTHAFTRSMFGTILDERTEHFRRVFRRNIQGVLQRQYGNIENCKKVCAYMEPENFASYIDEFPDATRTLCVKFLKVSLFDCDSYNISQALADLFAEIIRTAAATKRGAATKVKKKTDVVTTASDDDQVIVDALSKPLLALPAHWKLKSISLPNKYGEIIKKRIHPKMSPIIPKRRS